MSAAMTPYYSDDLVTIYHGDCREWMPEADVIVTDPPYGTGGWRRPEAGAGSSPIAALTREAWDDGAIDWLRATPTITFWPAARTWALLVAANAVGLTKHRGLYWQKPDPKPQVGGRTRWSIEPVWVLSKDGFLLYGDTDLYRESAIREHRDDEAVGHPYQKPESVMRWLVAKTRAETVLDPFMGSGSTLVAAKSLGRRAIGIEIEERYCEIAATRCSQEVLGLAI
jgi:site-specific DNA-methyltransferase (adenine-specific)